MTATVGNGKDTYVFVHRDNANEKVIVKHDDDPKLNESLNEIEAEHDLDQYHGGEKRGQYVLQSKKLGQLIPPPLQTDERADVKLEQAS